MLLAQGRRTRLTIHPPLTMLLTAAKSSAEIAPTRTQRNWPVGSTSAWMGIAAAGSRPRCWRKGGNAFSSRIQVVGPGRPKSICLRRAASALAASMVNNSNAIPGPSDASERVQRPRRSISSMHGSHHVAHRFIHVQRFPSLGSSAVTAPGSGRRAGQAKVRAFGPSLGYVFSQKPLGSLTAPFFFAGLTAAILDPVVGFLFALFFWLHPDKTSENTKKGSRNFTLCSVLSDGAIDPCHECASINLCRRAIVLP